MADRSEELRDEDPPSIEPYTVLELEKTATESEIKKAYRKAALRHHPDKASPTEKDTANIRFQEIAFAYAILSDPVRRKRYDVTGSTAETLSADDIFSWSEFYAEQYADIITGESIEAFSKTYKYSEEEAADVFAAYTKGKGDWSVIYENVMLSDPLEDEDRFRILIGEAIKGGEVERYETFMKGYVKGKEARQKAARAEGEEAEAYAKELGIHDKLFPKDKKSKKGSGEDALMALILKGQQEKRGFLEALEAKYAAPSKSRKGRKRTTDDTEHDLEDEMPSEEAFQAAAAKLKAGKEKAESQRKTKKSRR